MSNDVRFDELMARHLDHTLDATGRAELSALLRTDPARRREYLRLLEQEESLISGAREMLTPSARIEAARLPRPSRRLRRRSHIRRWTTVSAWAAAALVLVVVGVLALNLDSRLPYAAEVVGDVVVERAGSRHPAESLRHGDVLVARGAGQVRFPDGGVVELQPATRVLLRADGTAAGGVALRLERGDLVCALPTQPRGFTIVTSEAEVAVVGTSFRVVATAGTSQVAVLEGRVRVRSVSAEVQLSPGEHALITATGIRRAAHDAPARLDDPARWLAMGTLTAETTVGGAVLSAAPVQRDPRDPHQWSGRAWRWYAPQPSSAALAMQARFNFPAADDGIWHGEVSLAPPDAHLDADEAQPSPCLRLAVRTGIPTVVRRTTPAVDPEVLWTGALLPPGPRMLRLELRDGQVSALIDGAVVWRGPVSYPTVVPGVRWTRRAAGTAEMTIDQVALESLLPR